MTNAVTYAEVELGVHQHYTNAVTAVEQAGRMGARSTGLRDEIRTIEAKITYREVQIMDDEWARHADMAVTRMDKHVKAAQLKDPELMELHTELRSLKEELDIAESARAEYDATVRVESARMIELGGYLQYLAASKLAQRVRAIPEKQE